MNDYENELSTFVSSNNDEMYDIDEDNIIGREINIELMDVHDHNSESEYDSDNSHSTSGTSKTYNAYFTLPEPDNQSQPIVAGYIVSITEILDAMDRRFIAILTQSIQGIN